MMTIQEIEAKRAARKAANDEAFAAQKVADLTAIDALEEASGESLHTMTANRCKAGVPVVLAFRAPTAGEYKRYLDQISRAASKNDAGGRVKAQELLAESVWSYPAADDKDKRQGVRDAFPGTLISMAIEAAKVAELQAEETGKG